MKSMEPEEKPETVGEELYLVHLRRHEGEEPRPEDFDMESLTTKKRSYSIGEELWKVHVKRSRGVDCKEEENDAQETPKEEIKHCRYNLRTRRNQATHSP